MNRFIGYLLLILNLLSAMNIINIKDPNGFQMGLCALNILVSALILTVINKEK